eukprot:283082_1
MSDESTSLMSVKDADLTIFNNPSNTCVKNKQDSNAIICSYINRIGAGFKYYEAVFNDDLSHENQFNNDTFIQFNMEIYPIAQFLDDFYHLLKFHENDINLISNELINKYGLKQCDITNCHKIRRHYRANNSNNKSTKYLFHVNCYDRCHHFIFHLFKMGLRTVPMDINEQHNELSDDKCDYLFIDEIFKQKRDKVRSCRKQYDMNIQRYNDENNKYNIQIDATFNAANTIQTSTMTTLDRVYEFLNARNKDADNVISTDIMALKQYINDNEYDTDSLKGDLNDNMSSLTTDSNLYNDIKSKIYVNLMANYIRNIQLSAETFSTGFVFFYWNYYQTVQSHKFERDDDRYNGYSIKDLLVIPHHSSLKQEILSSSFVDINSWNENVVFKGEQYYQTENIKNMKTQFGKTEYGILKGALISLSHLYSVILYCDMTKLCTHFSATFRKKDQFETLKSLKTRHCKYYYFS